MICYPIFFPPVEENKRETGERVDIVWTGSGAQQKPFGQWNWNNSWKSINDYNNKIRFIIKLFWIFRWSSHPAESWTWLITSPVWCLQRKGPGIQKTWMIQLLNNSSVSSVTLTSWMWSWRMERYEAFYFQLYANKKASTGCLYTSTSTTRCVCLSVWECL